MFSSNMTHATIKTAKPQVHDAHPFKHEKNHAKLLDYLRQRLTIGKQQRDNKLPRLARIDKHVSGWMAKSDEDRDREIEMERTGQPQALTVNLPLTWVHLDDMMTYFAQTFSPNRGMFYHTGQPDESPTAGQIITIMNNHAIYSGYYRQVLLAVFNILKYNLGGFKVDWSKDIGPKLVNPTGSTMNVTQDVIWQGNKAESLDMYNTFWDPTVHPTQVYKDAEWAATAMMKSHYWLARKCSEGMYFNCDEALENDTGLAQCTYYRDPPSEARMGQENNGGTDWRAILSESPEYMTQTGYELVEITIRLNPMDFGLLPANAKNKAERNGYETWRFTLLNDKWIIDATQKNNIHGYLPYFLGMINDDLMSTSQKSVGEVIDPLQQFASFLLNTHVRATRKNLWGLVVYDPSVVDLGKIPKGEVSAKVPVEATGQGKDVNQAIWESKGTLDTKQTLQDLQGTMQIIDQFFPTQSLPSQIASIDRAVDSQVAAVQQGTNRRNHKTARLLDDSLFRPFRFALYYNVIQYQADGDVITDFYGKPMTIDLGKLRQTDLPFIIGQGLKALDRQAAAKALQEIIFAIIQNPQVAQQIDLLGLIDYWTSMIDIDIDMTQFHIQQQQAPQQGAPAGTPVDTAVAPISDPSAITAPLQNRVGSQ